MRLLFVADGRSPIAINWIRHFAERGDEVHLASTFNCSPDLQLRGLEITPVAFSETRSTTKPLIGASNRLVRLRTAIRHFLGPLTVSRASQKLREILVRVQPDLVHAMRIPYEGMLAADAYIGRPLLVSVWGNDFTLHAPSTRLMRHYTHWTMQVAHALHTDCRRDVRLAKQWGFELTKPSLVIPGNGGVRTDVFFQAQKPVAQPIVVNPRGARVYVRNDTFFQAIPHVLAEFPKARFLCSSLLGDRQTGEWIEKLQIGDAVELLPQLPHAAMADVFRRAQVVVSPSVHDGTPNSLLEGMACGCLPVAGDLESIREWITNGENGLLVDATDPQSLARGMIEALKNKSLRRQAAGINHNMILQRAEYTRCMHEAARFYKQLV